MPMKLLTLACGLACGVGLAIAVQAAGSRGIEDRRPDWREDAEERRSSARPNGRESDREFDRGDDRGDRRDIAERGERRRAPQAINNDRNDRSEGGWEFAARDDRGRGRPREEAERPEFDGSRRGRETAERSPRFENRRGGPGDAPRGRGGRRSETGRPRRQSDLVGRGLRGPREFANREPNWRPEGPRRSAFPGPRFPERGAGFSSGFGTPGEHPGFGARQFAGYRRGWYGEPRPLPGGPHFGGGPFPGPVGFGPGWNRPGFSGHQFAGHRPGWYGGPRPFRGGPYPGMGPFPGPAGLGRDGRYPRFGGHQIAGHRPGGFAGSQWPQGNPRFARRFSGPGPMWSGGAVPHHVSPFGHFDQNSDGKITKDEVLQLFAKADVNGDGSVTRDEFARLVRSAASPPASHYEKAGQPNVRGAGQPQTGAEGQSNVPPHGVGLVRPGWPGGPGFGPGPGGFAPGGFGQGGFGPRGAGPFGPGPQFGGPGWPGFRGPSAQMILERFDQDRKGFVTKDAVPEALWDQISKADANGDGNVSKEELEAHFKSLHPRRPERGGGSPNPVENPTDLKPEEKKPEVKPTGNSPQAINREAETPADAIAASNVAS